MEALVITGNLAEVGSRPDGGDCAFAGAGHSRGVVREVFDGGVADVVAVGHDVRLSNEGRLFQVTVGDVASGVVGAYQGGSHVRGKWVMPVVTSPGVVKVHPAHARTGCISGPQESGLLRHDLG